MTQQQKDESVNKFLMAAIIGLLSWNIYTTHQLSVTAAVLAEKIVNIERAIDARTTVRR